MAICSLPKTARSTYLWYFFAHRYTVVFPIHHYTSRSTIKPPLYTLSLWCQLQACCNCLSIWMNSIGNIKGFSVWSHFKLAFTCQHWLIIMGCCALLYRFHCHPVVTLNCTNLLDYRATHGGQRKVKCHMSLFGKKII